MREPAASPVNHTLAAGAALLLRTRWIVRAPVWLYRARLGFVFGSRLLMLEHTGRKTGTRRYVVLEAVDQCGRDAHGLGESFRCPVRHDRRPARSHRARARPPARRAGRLTAEPAGDQ